MKNLLFAASLLLSPGEPVGEPFVDLSFEQACVQAEIDERVVFVDFYTTWCEPCKRLDKQTWPDPSVMQWLGDNTVAIKVDAEKQAELAKRFGIRSYPSLLFASAQGELKGLLVGFRTPEQFLEHAQAVLDGAEKAKDLRKELEREPNSPDLKMALAKQLLLGHRLPEVLELFLWCFDHGLENPAYEFEQTRKTVLVPALQRLARTYPRVGPAMIERRDQARNVLMGPLPTPAAVRDLLLINRSFDKIESNLDVYDNLIAKKSQLDLFAREAPEAVVAVYDPLPSMFEGCLQPMTRARRFKDVVAGFGDSHAWLAAEVASLDQAAAAKPVDLPHLAALQKAFERKFGLLYQAMLATGEHDAQALALVKGYTAHDGRVRSWQALMQHARRAARRDVQKQLRAMALVALPPDKHSRIRKVRD